MPTSSRIASFEEDYAHSEIMMQELDREKIYKAFFPRLKRFRREFRKDYQKRGVDVIVVLPEESFWIEEKVVRKDWEEFALEYYSNKEAGILGWMNTDLKCDYLLYVFYPSKTIYLLKWDELKKLWDKNKREWLKTKERLFIGNQGSGSSMCLKVPIKEIETELSKKRNSFMKIIL